MPPPPPSPKDSTASWVLIGILALIGYGLGREWRLRLSTPFPPAEQAARPLDPLESALPSPACPPNQLPDNGYCIPVDGQPQE